MAHILIELFFSLFCRFHGRFRSQLDELEKKLADEVKVRNKAERRLRRAIKKLESLKILDVELSDGSIGSLSSNGRSGHQAPEVEVEAEERNGPGSLTIDGSVPYAPSADADRDIARESSEGSCTQVKSSSQDGSWCSVVSEQSRPGSCVDLAGNTTHCSSEGSGGDHDSERYACRSAQCQLVVNFLVDKKKILAQFRDWFLFSSLLLDFSFPITIFV